MVRKRAGEAKERIIFCLFYFPFIFLSFYFVSFEPAASKSLSPSRINKKKLWAERKGKKLSKSRPLNQPPSLPVSLLENLTLKTIILRKPKEKLSLFLCRRREMEMKTWEDSALLFSPILCRFLLYRGERERWRGESKDKSCTLMWTQTALFNNSSLP